MNVCAFPNGLLEVTITLARSYLEDTSWKRLAASASKGM
jgi:hypothetical protein